MRRRGCIGDFSLLGRKMGERSMNAIDEILAGIAIPPLAPARQHFVRPVLPDVAAAVRAEMNKPGVLDKVKQGDRVAITAGSRGIANLRLIVAQSSNA